MRGLGASAAGRIGVAKMALLDMQGAADYLGVSERHIRLLWSKRQLTGVKVGKFVRFDPADLDKYIQRQRIEAVR